MIELKTDPILALMPMEPRPAATAVAFAPYLDRAWGSTAAPSNAEAGHNGSDARNRKEARSIPENRDTAATHGPRADERRTDRRQNETTDGRPPSQATASEPSESSTEAASEGDVKPVSPGSEEAPQDQYAEGTAERDEGTDVDHSGDKAEEEPSNENLAAAAVTEAAGALVGAVSGQAAASGEGKPADGMNAETSEPQAEPEAEPDGSARDRASSETSSGETEAEPSVPSRALPKDRTNGGSGENGEDHQASDHAPEPRQSAARHGKAPTAREASQARVVEATASQPASNAENDGLANGGTTAVSSPVSASAAAPAVAPATATAVAGSNPTPAVEPVEGTGSGAPGTASNVTSQRTGPGAPNTPEADASEAVDRVRFVQRVARAFHAMGDRGGTVRLRLSPPDLGSLRVEITVHHGVMNARLEAETQAARQLLLDNLPMLRERLAEQDIKVEQFQVDLSDRPPGGLPDRSDERSQPDRASAGPERHQAKRNANGDDAEPDAHRRAGRLEMPGELDVLI